MRPLLSLLLVACAAAPDAVGIPVPVVATGQERIVSEDGEVVLLSGMAALQRVDLVRQDDEGTVPWLEAQVLDLGASASTVEAAHLPPPGTYGRLRLTFGPVDGARALSAQVQGEGRDPLEVRHSGVHTGDAFLAPRLVVGEDEGDRVGLSLELTGLLFYVRAYGQAEDGVFEAEDSPMDGGFVEANLVNMVRAALVED
ncbi:MAG: hypothetical protein H6732_10200 [Alphaproteobacteria bacterium]|nr:hypothetical protein [Alphaproteobacteria bacterium]